MAMGQMVGFIPSETFKIQSNCHFTYSTQNKQKTTILTATTKNRVKETSVTKKILILKNYQ